MTSTCSLFWLDDFMRRPCPQLELLLSFVRTGDTVFVHSMDRLARNLDDLRRIVQTLTGKGVRIEFVKEHLSFTGEDSPMASLMLSVMGAFAEFERALIHGFCCKFVVPDWIG